MRVKPPNDLFRVKCRSPARCLPCQPIGAGWPQPPATRGHASHSYGTVENRRGAQEPSLRTSRRIAATFTAVMHRVLAVPIVDRVHRAQ